MGWKSLELINKEDVTPVAIIEELCKTSGSTRDEMSTVVAVGQMCKTNFGNDLRAVLKDINAPIFSIPKKVKGRLDGYVYVALDSNNPGRAAVARVDFDS